MQYVAWYDEPSVGGLEKSCNAMIEADPKFGNSFIKMYTIKHAQEFSYNFVQNWFVTHNYIYMSLFHGGIIQVKGTFQNTIVAALNVSWNLTLKIN